MDEKPRPVWPWIVAALIGLLVLYPLAMGPWFWLMGTVELPYWVKDYGTSSLEPGYFAINAGPKWLSEWYKDYCVWWILQSLPDRDVVEVFPPIGMNPPYAP